MAQKINVALPEDVVIGDGWTVEWDAIDPNTGASVAGVIVSDASVTAADLSAGGGAGGFDSGPFMLVPGPEA
jgi:hypothetical protein